MNEEEIRALIREEIRALIREEIRTAFAELVNRASSQTCSGDEVDSAAAYVLKDVAEKVVQSLTPPEPEPVNPFAPEHTAEQWAVILRATIDAARTDGHVVWIGGYPELNEGVLYVGSGSDHPAFEEAGEDD